MYLRQRHFVSRIVAVCCGVGLTLAIAYAWASQPGGSAGQGEASGVVPASVVVEVLSSGKIDTAVGELPLEGLPSYIEGLLSADPSLVVVVKAESGTLFKRLAEVLQQLDPLQESGRLPSSQLVFLGAPGIEVPTGGAASEVPSNAAWVAVSEDGVVRVSDGTHRSVVMENSEELRLFASSAVSQASEKPFVVKLEDGLPVQAVQDIVDALRKAGVKQMLILSRDSHGDAQ